MSSSARPAASAGSGGLPPKFRRGLLAVAGAALALATAGCGIEDSSSPPREVLAAPPAGRAPTDPDLRGLRAQAGQLLDGGPRAFRDRLAELRGHPVVVNQWASWCDPCRAEFPFFAAQARKYEGRVAFLGIDSQDSRAEAERFLRELPVPFPHYFDEDAEVARTFGGGRAWPTTAFYSADGKLSFVHQGAYATEAKLEEDVRRYALDG